jgi:NADH-quinone oxidoreductase subunit K
MFFKEYLILAIILFFLGIIGILLNRKNIIIMLMSIEIILLSITFLFIIYSVYLDDLIGQVFSLYILTVAAAESAIALAILVAYYRLRGSIAVRYLNVMKG